ncbi:hypothetical protein B0A49_03864 [Cryomyces minteri]|uniref:Isotrichodermin C-15 hydroxylase n=1 Tax=Cryomyces minteri TaxID=331657 RepID=A0A4U0XFE7_9PEZI|nr:hypothetical protein B0A49_03864 [Cryomyces minteri]
MCDHPSAIIVSLFLLLVLRFVGYALYNVFLHPLASFPGPKSAAASYIPQFIARGKGNNQYIKELHDKYGSVVRIAPNELSFTNPQAWRDIYGHIPGQKQLPKQIVVDQPDLVLKAPHLILAPDAAHARMRRNLSHAFSSVAVKEQEPLMKVHFDKMVAGIKEQAAVSRKGRIDMEKMYNCVAFDVIGDLAFSDSFGALDRYAYHEFMIGVARNLKAMSVVTQIIPAAVKGRAKHFGFAAERVEARIARETHRKDFMWYILRHNEKDERGLSRQEIYSNAGLLIGAGSETTATLLTGTTYYLLKNPRVMQKLRSEIRSAFDSDADINITSASQLPYLSAVMEEGMRLYPPGPAANVRVTNHATRIDGNIVPKGVRVSVQAWTAHRSKSNFIDAENFIPERWQPGVDKRVVNDKRDAVQPFSYGPRNCLGKSLAYAEMYSIMARTFYNFDMELCSESEGWLDQRAFIFWDKGPLWRLHRGFDHGDIFARVEVDCTDYGLNGGGNELIGNSPKLPWMGDNVVAECTPMADPSKACVPADVYNNVVAASCLTISKVSPA